MVRKRKSASPRLHVEYLETRTVPSASAGGNDLIVRFIGTPSPATRQVLNNVQATVTTSWFDGQLALVNLPAGTDVPAALRTIRAVPQISYAEFDSVFDSAPNAFPGPNPPTDPQFSSQWALQNPGGVDINATLAWQTTTGSSRDLVAVLDTGVDYTHPDLYLAVAINQGEIPAALRGQIMDTNGNGIVDFYDLNSLDAAGNVVLDPQGHKYNQQFVTDTNGNGYIDAGDIIHDPRWTTGTDKDGDGLPDDLVGWNYLNNSNDPMDTIGHGTHVTGIIAARANNGIGTVGVNWNTRILPVEITAPGGVTMSAAIGAIDYAVNHGARVINASWGDFTADPALRDAIALAGDSGTVVVAAAGNQSNNNDSGPPTAYYPASFSLPNLLSVASVDPNGYLSTFSNYGQNTVDLAAPGSNILSTYLGHGYTTLSGTSMATPYVTGVVSLLADLYPNATAGDLVDRILASTRPLANLQGKVLTGGMLDANAALNGVFAAGPRVLSSTPTGNITGAVDHVTIGFDRPIQAGTLTTADVAIAGPNGAIAPAAVTRLTDMSYEVDFSSQTALGSYAVTVGPGIRDRLGNLMDQNQNGIPGEAGDSYTASFAVVPLPDEHFLDDSGAGFSASASWTAFGGDGWQGTLHYRMAGTGGDPATWTFSGVAPGRYKVSVTWSPYANRAPDATYTVTNGTTALGATQLDQRQPPADFLEAGGAWQDLDGLFDIATGTLVVSLSDQPSPGTFLIADAVRIERVADLGPLAVPQAVVLNGSTVIANGTGAVDFGRTDVGTPVQVTFTVRNAGTADLTLGPISLPSGFTLAAGFGATTLAPEATTTFTVQMNASLLGSFTGPVSIATNDPSAGQYTFTVSGLSSMVRVVDDGDAGFTASANWTAATGLGAQSDLHYKAAGNGTDGAGWTFVGLTPGRYRVSATWVPFSNRAPNAAYTVTVGSATLGTVQLDQRQEPASFTDGGIDWQDVGGPYDITGNELSVQLSDLATSGTYLIADAVRIEFLGSLDSTVAPHALVLDGLTDVPAVTGQVDFGHTDPGTPVARTLTVRNTGTANLTLGAINLPTGFSLVGGFALTTLVPGAATTFTIQMDGSALGRLTGTVSFGTNDPSASPYTFAVTGVVTEVRSLDDNQAGFSASGNWATYTGDGVNGELHYKAAGTGDDGASWTFVGLTPGSYRVSVTWTPYANRAPDATYTVLDGTTALASMMVDQRQTPATFSAGGILWQDLRGPYDVVSGSLTVRLSDLAAANSFLIADSVRIERLGSLSVSVGPRAAVLDGGNAVPVGTGLVDFGHTYGGSPVVRTLSVRNAGTADLTLGAIMLPPGFSLVSGFGATTLAPGAATSFSICLDATTLGSFGGVASFGSNDPNASPFTFVVSGAVSQVLYLDQHDAGFSASAFWTTYAGAGWHSDLRYRLTGSGADPATWTATGLSPGRYRVSVTWVPYANRSPDAAYTVSNSGVALGAVQLDQRQAPAGFTDGGALWQDLGGPYDVTGGDLVIRLSDLATPGTYLIADAVRVEFVGALSPAQVPHAAVLDGTTAVVAGTGVVEFGRTNPGDAVIHTFTVRNTGAADLTLGALTLPAGFGVAADFGTTTLAPGAATTFALRLDAAGLGSFSGIASLATNDPAANPYTFVVSGAVSEIYVMNDNGPGFSADATWTAYNGSGAQGDLHYKLAGSGASVAGWTFTGLTAGAYRIAVTWDPYSNRVPNATYVLTDGTSQLGTAQFDQRQNPTSFSDGGVLWQDLGAIYDVGGSTLVVQLSDLASPGYLIADAVRIERVGTLAGSAGPQVEVVDGSAAVAGGSGQVAFGRTDPGAALVHTFSVRNAGSADLVLGPIVLPVGFSLVSGFTATTLAPGSVTTFSVRLDAAGLGSFGGLVSFSTNDPTASPFVFGVTGTVSQLLYMDNTAPGFSASGNWSNYNGAGFQGNMLYKATGAGNDGVSWTFTNLAAGRYRVAVTWVAYSNRTSAASYTVFDGTTQVGSAQFDQRLDPASYNDAGALWQDLGGIYSLTSGTLVLRLSDLGPAGSYLIADGVRLEYLGL
jgi:subtilisin family serine protease